MAAFFPPSSKETGFTVAATADGVATAPSSTAPVSSLIGCGTSCGDPIDQRAAGRIIDMAPAPVLMRSWCFSYRASPAAWTEYWKPVPRPGWHDLLALTKNGKAVLEGDLLPFMTHLQYFKDVLALPRAGVGGSA